MSNKQNGKLTLEEVYTEIKSKVEYLWIFDYYVHVYILEYE